MEPLNTEHSRWVHQSMYPWYPAESAQMISNNISQNYNTSTDSGASVYYNHTSNSIGLHASNSSDISTPRSGLSTHGSSYLCHPVSPHSPPLNSSEGIGNCPSRLYLPNTCRSQGSSTPSSYNPSSMWQHMPGSLSLPQIPSAHKESGMSPMVDISPNYQDETKFKLNQNNIQNYAGFPPPHLYPQHMSGGDYPPSVGGVPFDMLPGMPRCRTISRSNSGKRIH